MNLKTSSQGVQHEVQTSQATPKVLAFTGSANTFAPKLLIKLQESNFMLWNQQVKGVILSYKLHKIVLNP